MLNSQCSILIRSGCRIAKCSTDKIPSASIKTARTCGRFSFRMRIEHWELNIGQILPSPHSAKLFFCAVYRTGTISEYVVNLSESDFYSFFLDRAFGASALADEALRCGSQTCGPCRANPVTHRD